MKKITFLLFVIVLSSCLQKTKTKIEKEDVKKVFPELKPNRFNVAFLIMDGTYNTELTAPFDIFQHTILEMGSKQ